MKIRALTETDLPAVLAVENAAQLTPWTLRMFRDALAAKNHAWVLEKEHIICGFIIFYLIAGECHILELAIAPPQQGNGYGKCLLNAVIKYAKEKTASWLLLEVRQSNYKALNLYRGAGFNEIGLRKNYYRCPPTNKTEDAIVLGLELN